MSMGMGMGVSAGVIVIGGGASGLFAAIAAASRGRRVVVLDAGERPARKVLIAGGGRCNFTNLAAAPEHYAGANPMFTRSALSRFSGADALRFFQDRGLAFEEMEPGRLFCRQGGGFVADILTAQCREKGVALLAGRRVDAVALEGGFAVTAGGERFVAESLIVATGGLAWPKLGALGTGYALAKQFGLKVAPPRPALSSFVLGPRSPFDGLSGITLAATLATGGRAFTASLLFTHKGLSGPAALNASCFWRPGETLRLNFVPGRTPGELLDRSAGGRELVKNRLGRFLPDRLAARLVAPPLASKRLADLTKQELALIAARLTAVELTPKGLSGFDVAEVTAGGVDTAGLHSKTMGVKAAPGLYFTGEVVDVTGLLGGFNLQWAWSSGWAAGQYA
ncbi:MAG: aminoacetone oxidase family FAD-binding enzyme [Desulfovibrionaceae bacterium]|nr:aminoacetone oxidase family FAD-binding enzyme [Desulfovibrionaceae bacterium]